MFCKYCSSELDGNSTKCGTCGADIDIYDGGQSFFEDGDLAEWSKNSAAMPRTKIVENPAPVPAAATVEPSRPKKSAKKKTGLIVILCASGVVLLALITVAAFMLIRGLSVRNEVAEIEEAAEEISDSLEIRTAEDIEDLIEDVWEGNDDGKKKGKAESEKPHKDSSDKVEGEKPPAPKTESAPETAEPKPATPKKPNTGIDTGKLPANSRDGSANRGDGEIPSGRYSVTIRGKDVDFGDCKAEIKEGVLYVSVNCIMSSLGADGFREYRPKEDKWKNGGKSLFLEIIAGTNIIYKSTDKNGKIELENETYEKEVGDKTHVYVPAVEFLEKWGDYEVNLAGNAVIAVATR